MDVFLTQHLLNELTETTPYTVVPSFKKFVLKVKAKVLFIAVKVEWINKYLIK